MSGDLVKRLHTLSQMINLGERISWGQDTALMDEAAAEIARLREALIEARHHVYQASIDRAQPTEASEALTLIDAALTASKEGKE